MPGRGARRDPAAQTDDEHVARVGMEQEGKVPSMNWIGSPQGCSTRRPYR